MHGFRLLVMAQLVLAEPDVVHESGDLEMILGSKGASCEIHAPAKFLVSARDVVNRAEHGAVEVVEPKQSRIAVRDGLLGDGNRPLQSGKRSGVVARDAEVVAGDGRQCVRISERSLAELLAPNLDAALQDDQSRVMGNRAI